MALAGGVALAEVLLLFDLKTSRVTHTVSRDASDVTHLAAMDLVTKCCAFQPLRLYSGCMSLYCHIVNSICTQTISSKHWIH